MTTLGSVVWSDGLTGRQPWEPAATLSDSVRFGLAVAGIDFFDGMDNYSQRRIRQASIGGWYHGRYVTVKGSYAYFDALDAYFEQTGSVSVGVRVFRGVSASIEMRGVQAGLYGQKQERESIVECGATVWVPWRLVACQIRLDHVKLEGASVDGLGAEPVVRIGLHTRRQRWVALGALAEVIITDKPRVRFTLGEEFWIHPRVGIGAGLCTDPFMIGAGISLIWRTYGSSVALVHHPQLGWSRGLALDKVWR